MGVVNKVPSLMLHPIFGPGYPFSLHSVSSLLSGFSSSVFSLWNRMASLVPGPRHLQWLSEGAGGRNLGKVMMEADRRQWMFMLFQSHSVPMVTCYLQDLTCVQRCDWIAHTSMMAFMWCWGENPMLHAFQTSIRLIVPASLPPSPILYRSSFRSNPMVRF